MNLGEVEKKFNDAIPKLQKMLSNVELRAAQNSLGLLNLRVFTGNDGAKDTRKNKLTPYTKGYAKFRSKPPYNQTSVDKNLQLTGQLMESVNIGLSNGKEVMGFTNSLAADKADWQEKQNKTVIFAMADDEKEHIKDDIVQFVKEQLSQVFR